jgi:hypothetical protein
MFAHGSRFACRSLVTRDHGSLEFCQLEANQGEWMGKASIESLFNHRLCDNTTRPPAGQ